MKPARGFTLIELAVATIVVAVLSALLLGRLQSYQLEADSAAVNRLVSALRTALSVRVAQLSVAKREHELLGIIEDNPMRWLVQPPENYLGEYYAPEEESFPDGVWYFDRSDRHLVYRAIEAKSFGSQKQILLKFKVKFMYLPLQKGKTSRMPNVIKGAVLDQVSQTNDVNN